MLCPRFLPNHIRPESNVFTGSEIVDELQRMGISHVVWVPDSTLGTWEEALEASPAVQLVRVCREGEAWPLAAGLIVGGRTPLVMLQTTGLFESGDALRNVLFDLRLPVFALIGARNWLDAASADSARRYAEPILRAWGLDYAIVQSPADKPKFAEHYNRCRRAERPGAVLLAEGR
jgi:sulfopyruvate decarboxylase TPP-binding subunit